MESQQRGSVEIQKVYDGILVFKESTEGERSCISRTNNLLMNAGTVSDEKFVTIGTINDYSCDQEEVPD